MSKLPIIDRNLGKSEPEKSNGSDDRDKTMFSKIPFRGAIGWLIGKLPSLVTSTISTLAPLAIELLPLLLSSKTNNMRISTTRVMTNLSDSKDRSYKTLNEKFKRFQLLASRVAQSLGSIVSAVLHPCRTVSQIMKLIPVAGKHISHGILTSKKILFFNQFNNQI